MDILWAKIQDGDPVALAFCLAAFSVLATWYSFYYQYRIWHWPFVWGDLLKSEIGRIGSGADRSHIATVEYTYSVDGEEFKGNRLSAMAVSGSMTGLLEQQLQGAERRFDGQVKVYYHPKKPHKAFLIRGSKTQVILTALYSLGAFGFTCTLAQRLHLF